MLTCKYLTFDNFLKTYIGRIKDNFSNFKVNFRTLIIIVGSGLKHSFVEKCQSRLDRFQIALCFVTFFAHHFNYWRDSPVRLSSAHGPFDLYHSYALYA